MLHWQLEWFLQLRLSEYRHNNSPSLSSNVSMDKICTRGSSGSSPWVTETQHVCTFSCFVQNRPWSCRWRCRYCDVSQLGGARKVQPAVSKFPNAQNNWKSIKCLQIFVFLNVQATFFKCKIVEAAGSGPKTGAGGSVMGPQPSSSCTLCFLGFGVASVRHPTEPGNRAKHSANIDLQFVTVLRKQLELL